MKNFLKAQVAVRIYDDGYIRLISDVQYPYGDDKVNINFAKISEAINAIWHYQENKLFEVLDKNSWSESYEYVGGPRKKRKLDGKVEIWCVGKYLAFVAEDENHLQSMTCGMVSEADL